MYNKYQAIQIEGMKEVDMESPLPSLFEVEANVISINLPQSFADTLETNLSASGFSERNRRLWDVISCVRNPYVCSLQRCIKIPGNL